MSPLKKTRSAGRYFEKRGLKYFYNIYLKTKKKDIVHEFMFYKLKKNNLD